MYIESYSRLTEITPKKLNQSIRRDTPSSLLPEELHTGVSVAIPGGVQAVLERLLLINAGDVLIGE